MTELLTGPEKICPECNTMVMDFEIVDMVATGNCQNCNHIWAIIDLRTGRGYME